MLVQRAGLTGPRSARQGAYDKDLVADLRERLFPGADAPLEALLAESDLPAEDLIRAFLATLQPFALMKTDILHMLAAAGARESGDSLKVRFNFDPDAEPLDLLLEQFRQQMESFADVVVESPPEVSYQDLWEIPRTGDLNPYHRGETSPLDATPGLTAWLARYEAGHFEPLPGDWRTGRADVDERLGRVADLADSYLSAFRRHAPDHDQLRLAAEEAEAGAALDPIGMTVWQLWMLESDYWPRAIARWVKAVRAAHRARNEASLAKMMAEIDRILPPARRSHERLKTLEDVLDLPVWKHRHEVYAVWLGAQIHRALEDAGWRFRFHLQDDRLEFAFRGVHLASLTHRDSEDLLLWWTELDSAHDDLPSGHRSRAIQPDYRIRKAPISDPSTDVVVVEAKQHLRSSSKEFADALSDYSHACPGAVVLLANYGPVSNGVLARVDETLRRRCAAYAHMHPGLPENMLRFRRELSGSLSAAIAGRPCIARETGVEVRLTWGRYPSDLDLYVEREDDEAHGVDYRRNEAEGLRYEADVMTGYGPEIVHIAGESGVFIVRVHRYSEDGELAQSGAAIELVFKDQGRRMKFEVPAGVSGAWWRAIRIDAAEGTATELDS